MAIGGLFLWSASLQEKAPKGSLDSLSTAEAPWPAELTHLRERLSAIGLPALKSEGNALHIHQHLDIFVHGKPVAIPKDIGVFEGVGGYIASVHVHDLSGIVHIESPTIADFSLGQVFDIWGVRFTNDCIGGYCTDATNTLQLIVDGKPYVGDVRSLTLTPHQEIVVLYGSQSEAPTTTPTTYAFPQGY